MGSCKTRAMPSQGMDKEMVNALSAAQQGKDVLAEMVVDLETQLDQTKSDKAAAYLDNSTLANEVRRFEGKLGGVCSERDRITEARSKEKSAFAQSIDELACAVRGGSDQDQGQACRLDG